MPRKLPPIDFHDLHRRYKAEGNIKAVAASSGIGVTTLRRHWLKLGLPTDARRPQRDWAALYRRYLGGESSTQIGESIGMAATSVRKGFERHGMPRRSLSEAKKLDMARYTPAERRRIAAASHKAIRGMKRSHESLCRRARTVERRQLHVSPLDRDMRLMLGGGTLQRAIGPYNCDVAFGPIAVEIFGGGWHASGNHLARHRKRTVYLLDHGWHVVVVWVQEPHYPLTVAASQYIVALSNELSSDPPAASQYRVIRGTGQEIVLGCAQDDKFPIKPPRERRIQVRCEHHL